MNAEPSGLELPEDAAAARRRLLLLMDHSLDLVELLGDRGVIEGVSSAITALAGYEPADLIGRHYRELIHPDDCVAAEQAFARVLNDGHSGPVTLRYRRKDGAWRTIRAVARNCLADPAARAVVVLTRDITDQVDVEASLAEANVELHLLSQQLILAQETERNHLARELHDDVQQLLIGLKLSLESAARSRATELPATLIDRWMQLVRETIQHLHELTLRLRPPTFDDRGLSSALHAHVDRVRAATGMDIHLELAENLGRFAPDLETACFRIIQEGLANAIRHSRAEHIRIEVRQLGENLAVTVGDDGAGFDVAAARERAVRNGSVGLLSMRERASLAQGRLDVESTPGHGTQVHAYLPIQRSASPALRRAHGTT